MLHAIWPPAIPLDADLGQWPDSNDALWQFLAVALATTGLLRVAARLLDRSLRPPVVVELMIGASIFLAQTHPLGAITGFGTGLIIGVLGDRVRSLRGRRDGKPPRPGSAAAWSKRIDDLICGPVRPYSLMIGAVAVGAGVLADYMPALRDFTNGESGASPVVAVACAAVASLSFALSIKLTKTSRAARVGGYVGCAALALAPFCGQFRFLAFCIFVQGVVVCALLERLRAGRL